MHGQWFLFTANRHGILLYLWVLPFFKFLEPTIFTLRFATSVLGLATIPLAWLLFRQWTTKENALIAGFLLATAFWPVLLSRIAFVAIATPLFDALMIFFLWQYSESRALRWLILAGFTAGMANYGYSASRLSLFLLIIGSWLFSPHLKGRLFKRLAIVGLGPLAAGIIMLPLFFYALHHSQHFTQRSHEVSEISEIVSNRTLKPFFNNLRAYFRMLHERGDGNLRHNIPHRPMLDPITGFLFITGIIAGIKNRRLPHIKFLWWWLLIYPVAASFTKSAPHALRTFSIIIPICFLCSLGLNFVLNRFYLTHKLKLAAILTVLALIGSINFFNYFKSYANYHGLSSEFSPLAHAVGLYLQDYPSQHRIILDASISSSVVRFIANQTKDEILDINKRKQPHANDVYIFRTLETAKLFININQYQYQEINRNFGMRFWLFEPMLKHGSPISP